MSRVMMIGDSAELAQGCLVCGAYHWDCTVDGCKPRDGNRQGDVLHCKVCNTAYVVECGTGSRAGLAARRIG